MKKLYILTIILFFITGCARPASIGENVRTAERPADSPAGDQRSPLQTSTETDTYTLMWYVNGSDLESGGGEGYGGAFTRNLQEMLSFLPQDDRFNIVIFSGGTEKWETVGFEAQINQVHYITQNGLEHGEQLPEGSIADPTTLAGFIEYAIDKFPADRYGLIFWDHGSSVPIGFGLDEMQEPKSINARDIAAGLDAGLGGARLSFVGFDTCLMATVETAALLAPYADYLLASEELEPNGGWNYTPVMYELSRNPAINTLKLCKTIANVFYNTSLERIPDDLITISVTDLSKIGQVVAATEKFALAAKNDLNTGGFTSLSKRRAGTKYFGGVNESADMVDLIHLAQRLRDKYPDEANELIAAVRAAVAHNRHSKTSPHSNGLSIYFPFENEAILEDYLDVYLNIGFTKSYIELVRDFSAQLKAGDADTKSVNLPVKKLSGRYVMNLPDESSIVAVRAVLMGKEGSGTYYIYSYISGVACENGKCTVRLPKEWLTLHMVPACAQAEEKPEGDILYSVPAMINEREMNIMLTREDSTFELLGATPDGDEDDSPAPGFIPLVDGDTVTPKYPRIVINSDREEDGFYLGEPFTVSGGSMDARMTALPSGKYYFAFYLTDVYDNQFLSEVIEVKM